MGTEEIIYLTSRSLLLVLILSMPSVLIGALVGLLVGLFQGLTQIQDQTISFALRLIATAIVLIITARWMGNELYKFSMTIFEKIVGV